jgi:cell division septum initiation protein DivIVA
MSEIVIKTNDFKNFIKDNQKLLQNNNSLKQSISRFKDSFDINYSPLKKEVQKNKTKRSGGYINNATYLIVFLILPAALKNNFKIKTSLENRRKNKDNKINFTNIDFKEKSISKKIANILNNFKFEIRKITSTINSDENKIIVSKAKKIINKVIELIENHNVNSFSSELLAFYILSVRFNEANKIHTDFDYFSNWDNYVQFFDLVENHDKLDIEFAYNVAEEVKDLLGLG